MLWPVQKPAAILLLLCFVALGTGAMEYLHNLEHARQDAILSANSADQPVPGHHTHDETNCEFHSQLHLPMMAAGWVPLLVLLGLFVAFLSELTPQLADRPVPSRLVCRGPPMR